MKGGASQCAEGRGRLEGLAGWERRRWQAGRLSPCKAAGAPLRSLRHPHLPPPPTTPKRSTLGALAEKCHAYAKALHYKELEFQSSPHTAVEALISINNQLRQPDAAVGVLNVAQKELHMDLKESW